MRKSMSKLLFRLASVTLCILIITLGTSQDTAAQTGYQVRAGDTLTVEVLEDGTLNRSVLVLPDGSINFPLVGTVQARGRTPAELQQILASGLASNFAVVPTVFVSVNALAERRPAGTRAPKEEPTIDAFIVGEVASPGRLEVPPGTTILQLLAQAGGPTRFAAEKRIELRRADPLTGHVAVYLFSYTGKARGPRIPGSTILADGDVVVVPVRRLFE